MVAVHTNPIWRDRSDFIIAAEVDDDDLQTTEQLFARQIGPLEFEICCIPFFVYGIALGDTVATDANHVVQRVSGRSGRSSYRVWFGGWPTEGGEKSDPVSESVRESVCSDLASRGAALEWSSENHVGVDASTLQVAADLEDYLADAMGRKLLIFETGYSANH